MALKAASSAAQAHGASAAQAARDLEARALQHAQHAQQAASPDLILRQTQRAAEDAIMKTQGANVPRFVGVASFGVDDAYELSVSPGIICTLAASSPVLCYVPCHTGTVFRAFHRRAAMKSTAWHCTVPRDKSLTGLRELYSRHCDGVRLSQRCIRRAHRPSAAA